MGKPETGFVGLGVMGSAMGPRLPDCGYPLTVPGNRTRAGLDATEARGAIGVTGRQGEDMVPQIVGLPSCRS